MKTSHLSIIVILFVTGTGIAFAQSNNTPIQNGVRSTNSTCMDDMIQDMKTKYASFDEEQAKAEAINYESFKSEIKNDTYKFDAVSQGWTNDFAKCTVIFKNALVLFTVTDALGKERDVTVLINPESYKPQSIDVKYDVPTHGGIIATILSPLKQLEAGTNADQVKCNQGFQLIFKQENMFPICVKPDTSKILIERGWASPIAGISFGNQYTSKIPDLPVLYMPCDTPYPQSNTGVAVLYMPANSVGKICVKYHNLNDIPEKIFGISIYDPNNSNQNVTGVTTWSNSTDNTIPKGNSTVDYWIKTGNQTGIYAMELFCTGTPFAIGYDNNSKIVSSDFPWNSGTIYCPMQSYEFHIDSLSGIGVKYIPYP